MGAFSFITALIPPIIIVAFIIIVIVVVSAMKTKSKKEVNNLLRNIYVYIVLFVTLMMTIGGSVGAFMALSDIIFPAPYLIDMRPDLVYEKGDNSEESKLSEEELLKRWEKEQERQIENKVMEGKNNLIKSLGWVIIPLPIFVYYQRRLTNKEKEES